MSAAAGPLGPPDDLARRALPVTRVSGPLFRFHAARRSALHFGRGRTWRFDDPRGRFGVLYAGSDLHVAFAETFGPSLRAGVVRLEEIAARSMSRIDASRPLALVDLAGSGHLARVGADARLFAGEHDAARRWSAAFHAHPSAPDGILYPARHDPARSACAIFDRAKRGLRATRLGSLAEPRHARILVELLDAYGAGLGGD